MSWWPFHRRRVIWQIQPRDQHWNGHEASVIIDDGWEPFAVSAVANIQNPENWIRLWLRRPENFKKRKPYEVKVQLAGWGGHQVSLHLSAEWEPFGAQDSFGNHVIWFKRPAP